MRTEGDTWSIVDSVGLTALGVAAFRAFESIGPDALIQDEFAPWFVAASGEPHVIALLKDPASLADMPFAGFMGMRTKFFDDFFLSAAALGVRQAVILAAGLDARAYRLDWPPGTTVFEVDQPKVLEFKGEVLAEHDARPKADRRPVAVDLRDDWPAALEAAGFDRSQPAAWSVEGLLPYLPGSAHDALFARIDELSPPGSHLAVDAFGGGGDMQRFAALREKFLDKSMFGDNNPFGDVDVFDLFYSDERADPPGWLVEHGWSVEGASSLDLAEKYGRPAPEIPEELADLADLATRVSWVTAVK
ncbi:SAM-dependent methyltransferase [Rhodococcus sp. WMMA185]|uniref:class I SAM-dependent methyltransferase n=1 Tax=Rhodococcus sp. WMMA185 TaxID=679318 RepID=UPI00087835F4|nr:class I SAM-dependent methyltransferase [Rhodococcus sp. WMMA185]AOW92717.1 SAM-dependent methyltransferase [Rhodococcus sp. WMMA185]